MFARTDETAVTNRAGFALPLAILVIGMLTAAVAAGFAATASEAVVNNAQRAQDRAYQIAEAGLQQFMTRRSESGFCSSCQTDPTAPASPYSENTRVQLNGGYADVVSTRVWNPTTGTQSPVFFIYSKGVDTAARMSIGGGTIFAERTVGVYARWSTTTMPVLGALMSLNGLTRPNNAGTEADVDRRDQCNKLPDLTVDLMARSGAGTSIQGTPALVVDQANDLAALTASQAINWSAIVNNDAITAGYTITSAGVGWPVSYAGWPIIRIKNSAAGVLPIGTGYGIVIAEGDLTVPKGANWEGVILIGGRLITNTGSTGSQSTIDGAVVSGLNRLLPGAPADNGTADNDQLYSSRYRIRYDSCNVTDAGHRLRGYTPLPNTWMDNVANW